MCLDLLVTPLHYIFINIYRIRASGGFWSEAFFFVGLSSFSSALVSRSWFLKTTSFHQVIDVKIKIDLRSWTRVSPHPKPRVKNQDSPVLSAAPCFVPSSFLSKFLSSPPLLSYSVISIFSLSQSFLLFSFLFPCRIARLLWAKLIELNFSLRDLFKLLNNV